MQSVRQLQALADPTRLRLLALLEAGPLCVCHFQTVLREPQVKISKHLAVLRARGFVKARRDGTWMVYSLVKPAPKVLALLEALISQETRLQRDRERRAQLDLSCTPAVRASGRRRDPATVSSL